MMKFHSGFLAEDDSICVHPPSIPSSADGQVSLFFALAFVNSAAVHIGWQMPLAWTDFFCPESILSSTLVR